MSPEDQQRKWMGQWRSAEVALKKIKAEELRALTNEQALRDSDMLLELAPDAIERARRSVHSGLVEQQRLFQLFRAARLH